MVIARFLSSCRLSRHARAACLGLLAAAGMSLAHVDDGALLNRGGDPFLQVSSALPGCPEPAGPRVSEAEWMRESHHRIEHGNHCWLEGRCRLPNAYLYDKDVAESLQRRLRTLNTQLPAWRHSSLWITVSARWIKVQGCVAADFPSAAFFSALGEVADAERVIDQTTATPARGVPYPRFSPSVPGAAAAAPQR